MVTQMEARMTLEEQIALKKCLIAFVKRITSVDKKASEAEIELLPQILNVLTIYF